MSKRQELQMQSEPLDQYTRISTLANHKIYIGILPKVRIKQISERKITAENSGKLSKKIANHHRAKIRANQQISEALSVIELTLSADESGNQR